MPERLGLAAFDFAGLNPAAAAKEVSPAPARRGLKARRKLEENTVTVVFVVVVEVLG